MSLAFIAASQAEENPARGHTARDRSQRILRGSAAPSLRQKSTLVTGLRQELSTGIFCPTVAKMQKNQMTAPNVWANFGSQNRHED
ncbi:MAG TPA: hypothetical protein VGO04_11945 [Ensifer sp.]|uniref:hypothetical protein n=1 Tax=Ensifer sp. TaxID=1872086 RepID=UPI002E165809|nr:hypothetical protein [Ensifer sp.]